jgi:TolA-binding protein
MTTGKLPGNAEDWVILARRGALSGADRAEFERALEGSVTLRAAHCVGRDFDAIRDVRAGDDELVLRASAAALAEPRVRKRIGRRVLALSAAALAVAASAAAASLWIETSRTERLHADHGAEAAGARPPKASNKANTGSSAERGVHALDAGAIVATPEPVRSTQHTPSKVREPAAEAHAEKTAASLFTQASAARRAGELDRAQLLFAELQRSFPSTSEARVSRVSLGKLLLGAGRAREAEQQFRAYLTQRGDLTEEALVGRAESLARLGQRAEERGVWRELLTSRPSSVYASRARERLRELAPGENDPTRAP